tara:strand:- start:2022 stop:2174 length:153 start_codon:yes stop_codon:yes gene_type:complete
MPSGKGTYGSKLGRPPFKGKQTKKGSMPAKNRTTTSTRKKKGTGIYRAKK